MKTEGREMDSSGWSSLWIELAIGTRALYNIQEALIEGLCLPSELKYSRLFPNNAILEGKRWYVCTIETQAARNFYTQYVKSFNKRR